MNEVQHHCADEFLKFLSNKDFPCIAAKASHASGQIMTKVAGHLGSPEDDREILRFLYAFVDQYRASGKPYHSAAVIFRQPNDVSEKEFDQHIWSRLQALSNLDAMEYGWDPRVNADASSADFSYSLKSEALYVIGLHGNSSRPSRRFHYPTLVFNPHNQFVKLRENQKYGPMKEAVRKRDIKFSGSVNPMLTDFGEVSEARQYSGKQYDESWQCPFKSMHRSNDGHPTP